MKNIRYKAMNVSLKYYLGNMKYSFFYIKKYLTVNLLMYS